MPRCLEIFSPSSGFDLPLNSISRLCGARSIQVACPSLTTGAAPGTVGNRGMGDSTLTTLSLSISLDVGLLGTGHSQGIGRYVVRDHRPGRRPGAVVDRHGRDEDIMRAGVDVLADDRAVLADAVVVCGDRAGPD